MDDNKPSRSESGPLALSAKSAAIMQMIAGGHTHEQILKAYPEFTQQDIAAAAQEALAVPAKPGRLRRRRILARFPRAYEGWTPDEENQVMAMLHSGEPVAQIAAALPRKPGAIRSRIVHRNLTGSPTQQEGQARERAESQTPASIASEERALPMRRPGASSDTGRGNRLLPVIGRALLKGLLFFMAVIYAPTRYLDWHPSSRRH